MRKISVLLLILLVCLAIICGCSVPSSSPAQPAATASQPVVQSTAPTASGAVKNVEIIQWAFDPSIVRISPGDTVSWTNKDTINHRVVHLPELPSDRELFHSELLSVGQSFSYTFTKSGRYEYADPQYAGGRTYLVIVE